MAITRDAPAPEKASNWRDIRRVSVTRSQILMGIGALIGLVLAGVALFTAKGTSTLAVPAEDVALVNQQPINRSDFIAQLQTIYNVSPSQATPEQRQKVLNDMIREELFVQRAKELDVASTDPDTRSAMVNAVEQLVAADAITAQPLDEKLQAYYTAHQSRYSSEGTVTLADYVFPLQAPQAAAQAAQALKSGAPAAQTVAQFQGKNSNKVKGEEFYFAARIHLGDALFDRAAKLPDGGVSDPITMPDRIHVIQMIRNLLPVPLNFAAARERVLTDYRNDAMKRLKDNDTVFLRKRANILIADDLK